MTDINPLLARIAEALERLAPPLPLADSFARGDAFVWDGTAGRVSRVDSVDHVPLAQLRGIDFQIEAVLSNTRRFAAGHRANNVLLWGARGTGKSSLVKAVHAEVSTENPGSLVLLEVPREDLPTLPRLLPALRDSQRRFIILCDDLSFETGDAAYKSLKAVLEGGVRGQPANVLLYATSNRRHLMPREMIDNERSTAINPAEAVEEKVSLSDRFGLWIGFHAIDQVTYLRIVDGYAAAFALDVPSEQLHAEALAWSMSRGARSGRVAWQFVISKAETPGIS